MRDVVPGGREGGGSETLCRSCSESRSISPVPHVLHEPLEHPVDVLLEIFGVVYRDDESLDVGAQLAPRAPLAVVAAGVIGTRVEGANELPTAAWKVTSIHP